MKKKIGTVLDVELLEAVKVRAVREHRALADVLHDALVQYLARPAAADAARACAAFCAYNSPLPAQEIREILDEDPMQP